MVCVKQYWSLTNSLDLRGSSPRKGMLQRLSRALDSIHLVTATLLVLVIFLQTAVLAGAVHLWSIRVLGTYSPHLLLFSLLAASSWAQGFLQAVHRSTVAAVVSTRYCGGQEVSVEQGGHNAPAKTAAAPTPASIEPNEQDDDDDDDKAPLTQGAARDFGDIADGEGAAPAGAVVVFPTAMECLLAVVERHGGALAKGR